MSRFGVPAAAVAAAAAIATAGCASAGASGPGSLDGAASLVPGNAIAFVAASTDLSSSRWHGIAKPFLQQFQTLAPALGDELDVAVLPGKQLVGFTQPGDAAKLSALARKHGALTRAIGGWTAIAKTSAALDTVAGATSHLADTTAFVNAMNRLPNDALVRAYANGDEAGQLVASIPGLLETTAAPSGVRFRPIRSKGPSPTFNVGTTEYRWVAAALTSTSDGLKLEAYARIGGLVSDGAPRLMVHPVAPFVPGLPDEIPSGVLAVVDFQVPQNTFENEPNLAAPLAKLFGPSVANVLPLQLDTLLGGETALYIRQSLPVPVITLVTQPSDTAAASSALDSILSELPPTNLLSGLKLHRTTIGGQFVVSTTQQGLDDFRGGGPKLSADPSFLAAKKQAGLGDETTGFVYANVKDALPLLSLVGIKLPAGMPSLGTFMAFGGQTSTEATLTAFLGVASS